MFHMRAVHGIIFATLTAANAPAQTHGPQDSSVGANDSSSLQLKAGTVVQVRPRTEISSAAATAGQQIALAVCEDVRINNVTIIWKGSDAWATITVVQPGRSFGRRGKLELRVEGVRLVNGESAALSATDKVKGASLSGAVTGGTIAAALLLWPAAVPILAVHGKDAVFSTDACVPAYAQSSVTLDARAFAVSRTHDVPKSEEAKIINSPDANDPEIVTFVPSENSDTKKESHQR